MSFTADVAIVGAGIVGAACAMELAKEKFRVTVVDGSFAGSGATAAGMGHLVVMDDSEAQFALTQYSVALWRELSPELPADCEYETRGSVWVAAAADEMEEVRRKSVYYRERGVDAQILDARALHEAEPNLREQLPGGLLVPQDAVLYAPCAARFLLRRAVALGATARLGSHAVSAGRSSVRLSDGTSLSAKFVVNAAGQNAPALTPGIAIKPRKGHLVITDRYPGMIHHQVVELGYLKSAHSVTTDSVAFNLQPRKTGQILIGSSRQYDVEYTEPDSAMVTRMLRRAFEFMPALERLSAIRVWTGFRAATPDKLPLIGVWPADESVILAAGHEGLGITTSLATGRIVADGLLQRRSAIPTEPYSPSRQMPAQR
jgi:glycine/D-amino acid oxidase-like deaminating enzyme